MNTYLTTQEAYDGFIDWKRANPDGKSKKGFANTNTIKEFYYMFRYQYANIFFTQNGSKQDYELVRAYYPELVNTYDEMNQYMNEIYALLSSPNTSYSESVRLKRIATDCAQAHRKLNKEIYARWEEIGKGVKPKRKLL